MSAAAHLLLILATEESAQDLLGSDILPALTDGARLTLLSALDDAALMDRFAPFAEWIMPLLHYPERRLLSVVRSVLEGAPARGRTLSPVLDTPRMLDALTAVEWHAGLRLRPRHDREEVGELLRVLRPDVVLNCSSAGAPGADLILRVARDLGVPTAGCVFSGEDLVSRSQLVNLYDYFFVPDEATGTRLLALCRTVSPARVVAGEAAPERRRADARRAAYRGFAGWWVNQRERGSTRS